MKVYEKYKCFDRRRLNEMTCHQIYLMLSQKFNSWFLRKKGYWMND